MGLPNRTCKVIINWDNLGIKGRRWMGKISVRKGLLIRILPLGWVEIAPPFEWIAEGGKSGGLCIDLEASLQAEIKIETPFKIYRQNVGDILTQGYSKTEDKRLIFYLVKPESGEVEVTPSRVVAGREFSPRLVFKAGKEGMKEHGGIRVLTYQRTDWKMGEIEALTTREGVKAVVNRVDVAPDTYSSYNEIGEEISFQMFSFTVNIQGGDLLEGDRIIVNFNSSRAQTFVDNYKFLLFSDANGDGIFAPVKSNTYIEVMPEEYDHLRLVVPSIAGKASPLIVNLQAMDKYNNLCNKCGGEVRLQVVDDRGNLCGREKIIDLKSSSKQLALALPDSLREGIYYVLAQYKDQASRSNPFLLKEGKYKIFWGALHTHTYLSDGYGSPDFAYKYAREVSRLDFAALSEHSPNITPNKWELTRRAAHKYHEPHRFVTFLGHAESAFEWVESINCYYLSEDEVPRYPLHRIYYGPRNMDFVQPLYYRDNLHEQLKKLAEEEKVLLISHIHGGTGIKGLDIKKISRDARYCPLLEIYSEWGAKEYPGNPWSPSPEWIPQEKETFCYQEVLARGIKVGVVGDGDDHVSMPGSLNLNPHRVSPSIWKNALLHPAGITAVFAPELTRESILKSLRSRRCYATTSPRILLDFKINGHCMGEEISLRENPGIGKERRIEVIAAGTCKGVLVELIRNNQVIKKEAGEYACKLCISDTVAFQEICLKDAEQNAFIFYYVRVTDGNGHIAWSSPIWVEE